ncbi:MAG: Asp-tRNA(Asn)/Glu-tRNA(Gln) amidotransferase subunit GatC [Bacillota bacterium]
MTALTREEVRHIAHLARLAFEPDELDRFTTQLNAILQHVNRLGEVDTALASPTASVSAGRTTPLREDEPWEGLTREEALDSAPAADRGLFKVPRIVD